jgi:hypothetical protein
MEIMPINRHKQYILTVDRGRSCKAELMKFGSKVYKNARELS